jgi:50S ribosomal protein uL3
MAIGLVGRKRGMTRVFTESGETVPVTVVEVLANRVTQVKDEATDGYRAVQVTYGARRPQLLGKALAGHYAKAAVAPGKSLVEFRLAANEGADIKAGTEFTAEIFKAGQVVDVTGTTIGKGFAGVMKRHNFAGGPASHGHSVECFQTNHEGELVDAIHAARQQASAIIINPGAFTHYSWALHDALAAFDGPVIEVHISNPNAREPWRHTSVVAPVATGSIIGLGIHGYELAVHAIALKLAAE